MEFINQLGDTIAMYYETNTELALWVTITLVAALFLVIMLASPAFRRFMAVVIVISLVIGALLVNFGEKVVEGL